MQRKFFAEVITIKTLFALAKPWAIADCRGEFGVLEYASAFFFPGTFYILLRKEVLGELRNGFLQIFGETSLNKLLSLPKKSLYIISLNKKIKWL